MKLQYKTECIVPMFLTSPVVIGKIIGAYGILGWVRILSFTEQYENIFKYRSYFVTIEYKWKPIYLETWKMIGKRYIAKIRGISNRDAAQLLARCNIVIDETQLPRINNDEYYWKDLIGCKVITVKDFVLGKIINIIDTTANDVLVVKEYTSTNFIGKKDYLIPFLIERVIKNVDLIARIVIVDWDINF